MPFASFETHVKKCFAIVLPRCQVISHCDVMLLRYLSRVTCYKQRYSVSNEKGDKNKYINTAYNSWFATITKIVARYGIDAMYMYAPRATDMQIRARGILTFGYHGQLTTAQIHWFSYPGLG